MQSFLYGGAVKSRFPLNYFYLFCGNKPEVVSNFDEINCSNELNGQQGGTPLLSGDLCLLFSAKSLVASSTILTSLTVLVLS